MYLFCADVFHRAALQDAASGRISFACLVSLSVSAAFAYSLLKTFTARPIAGLPENLYGECALLTVLALWVMRREVLKQERTHVFIKKLDDFYLNPPAFCGSGNNIKYLRGSCARMI